MNRKGFTLVEILLALAILSTILVLLLSSFTGAGRTLDILAERSGALRQVRISMDRIGTDLAGALSSDGNEATAFSCKADKFSGKPASTLVFTAFLLPDTSGTRPPSGLVKIRYYPKVSEDGNHVELHREQSDLPLIENGIPSTDSRLASDLRGFRVEMFDGRNWVAEWPPSGSSKFALPARVAFILTDSRGREYKRTLPLFLAGQQANTLFSGKRSR